MRFGYVRTNGNGLQEIGHGFFRLILLQVEVRELNEGLRVLYRALSLPGDGVFEGLHGLVAFAQSLERQSHVVFRLNVVWFELQALLKGFNRLRKLDRKSTRLNSSHGYISYAVFCLKKNRLP